jgi:tRNA pseudouridine55 synthase
VTDQGPQGIALVDKPAGWTSHDVVAKARGLLGTRKVGHAGTLDPSATGLLVLGVGRATKLLTFLSGSDKTYTGEAVLGRATSTLDAEGETTGTWDMSAVTLAQVREATAGLTGVIQQVPPMVSAKKVGGRRLHELARAGVEVERQPVEVRVDRFAVGEPVEPGVFPIEVTVSSGTYVRSLVADLGAVLGGGAHLRNLRRHTAGRFDVAEAVPLERLTPAAVLPSLAAFRGVDPVKADDELVAAVRHGKVLPLTVLGVAGDGPWPVVDPTEALIAVYVPHRGATAKPALVLT